MFTFFNTFFITKVLAIKSILEVMNGYNDNKNVVLGMVYINNKFFIIYLGFMDQNCIKQLACELVCNNDNSILKKKKRK